MSDAAYTILAVDDVEQNLDILVDTLSNDYDVAVATDGQSALEAAADIKPDLVLLDIMMPGMDGYEVCKRLKRMAALKDVPVIFVSALSDITDETKGFEVGGADYIIKPYSPAIVLARVEAHLKLFTAQRDVRDMLDKTLKGSIHLLTDILSLTSPAVFGQSSRVRRLVREMANRLKLDGAWRYELAAMLSQLGCIALPQELLTRLFLGEEVSQSEAESFEEHPQVGAELLMRIPRLEAVAQMISRQRDPMDDIAGDNIEKMDEIDTGGQLLRMALDFDDLIVRGKDMEEALQSMDGTKYPEGFMDLFGQVVRDTALEMDCWDVQATDVLPGMILDQDVLSIDGALVARAGMEVSASVYNILTRMGRAGKINMNFRVLVPT